MSQMKRTPLRNGVFKIKRADYSAYRPAQWNEIHPADQPIYDRLYAALVQQDWMTPKELAKAHFTIHCLLERKP